MFVVRAGQSSPLVPLQAVLREIHDDLAARVDAAIASRKSIGAPLIDEATGKDITPLSPYEPDPDIDGVRISVRALPLEETTALSLTIAAPATDKVAHERTTMTEMRRFVAAALAEVTGLVDAAGPVVIKANGRAPLTDDDITALESAGSTFFFRLFTACRHYQGLTGPEKKVYGARQP